MDWPRRLRPQKIDLYILSEVLGPFLGGIIFFAFVFLMFQALRLADFFIIHGVAGSTLLKMAGLMILSFLPTALPVAFLIGILVGFGRLSADSELVAMKANGISAYRLAMPAVALSLVVVGLSFGLNLKWVPQGDHEFKRTLIKVGNTKVVSSIREGTFTSGFFDLLLFADKVNPKTNRLHHVFIFDEREPKNPLAVIAGEGEVVPVKSAGELGSAVMLRLYRGNIHRNDIESNTYQKIDFGQYQLYLKIDEASADFTVKPRMIEYDELKKRIQREHPKSSKRREYVSELWRRYSLAVVPLIFVFLGIGFGTVRTRAVRAGAALVAFIVIFIYWMIQAAGTMVAYKGYVPPVVAMLLPDLVMLAIAIPAYRSATW